MSRKSLLNVTSRKKRNGMLGFSNTSATGTSLSVQVNPLVINGAVGGTVLWCATAQDLLNQNNLSGTTADQAQRTATSCFMRGLNEHIRVQTNDGTPWFWRRICFTSVSNTFLGAISTADSPIVSALPFVDSTAGIQRLTRNQSINAEPNSIIAQQGIIFRGAEGNDWNDPILAPTDSTRIKVKFDKTWTLKSGNANGTVREMKLWHPMNKTIVYDDDENGSIENTTYFSVNDFRGMGNYFVYDIIRPGVGGSTSNLLSATFNSTLYWHER